MFKLVIGWLYPMELGHVADRQLPQPTFSGLTITFDVQPSYVILILGFPVQPKSRRAADGAMEPLGDLLIYRHLATQKPVHCFQRAFHALGKGKYR